MCCNSDCSLKLIALACILIIATDTYVMHQILEKQNMIHLTVQPKIYNECYKPQIRMRLIFTGYAVVSAIACFILTSAVIICDEFSEWFDKIVNYIIEFIYFAFGPALFTFCIFGVT